jgi:hypothetical protein
VELSTCLRFPPNSIHAMKDEDQPDVDDDFQQLKALNVTAILSLQTEEDGQEGAIESEAKCSGRSRH